MDTKEQDEYFVRQAYAIALHSAKNGFDPFGALLVKGGKVMGSLLYSYTSVLVPYLLFQAFLFLKYFRLTSSKPKDSPSSFVRLA